ncbi:MAG: ScyD/ScyE family protein [Acidobacteria bacterium]|nr:ScyD/ScyE family protein [Acidobacteriota bacterium]
MKPRIFVALLVSACTGWAQPEVIATGLQSPQRIIVTPDGNLLVSEPSATANSGRVSLVTRAGARRSLLEGLPSGESVEPGTGSGPSAMALRGRTFYLAIGVGDWERRAETPGAFTPNPRGVSSPIFSSILGFQFNADIDAVTGTFRMTPEQQTTLAEGAAVELNDGSGATARVSVLARFPNSEPDRNTVYRVSNPWGLALSEDGTQLFVADAGMNALALIDTATGRWRRPVRFPPVANPGPVGPPVIDAVPTSVRLYGDQVLMSFLTGFPFPPGSARVLAVNPQNGTTEPFIFGISSTTDVLWRRMPDGRSQFFVLEFSQDQSARPPAPGRLLRYDSPAPQVVSSSLITPVSLAYDESTQDLYILELRGQILRLHLD